MKRSEVGKRFSKRAILEPESPADIVELDSLHDDNFEAFIERHVSTAREVLRAASVPVAPALYWTTSSDQPQTTPPLPSELVRFSHLPSYVRKELGYQKDSPVEIAAEIINWARLVHEWTGESRDRALWCLAQQVLLARIYSIVSQAAAASATKPREKARKLPANIDAEYRALEQQGKKHPAPILARRYGVTAKSIREAVKKRGTQRR